MELIKKIFFEGLSFPKEHRNITAVALLFLGFPYLMRYYDPTAASIDPGALSAIIMSILALLLFKASTWWILRNIWPVFAVFGKYHFETLFKLLNSWQKIMLFLGFYVLLLYAFIFIFLAII